MANAISKRKPQRLAPQRQGLDEVQTAFKDSLFRLLAHPDLSSRTAKYCLKLHERLRQEAHPEARQGVASARPSLRHGRPYQYAHCLVEGQIPASFRAADGSRRIPANLVKLHWDERVLTSQDFKQFTCAEDIAYVTTSLYKHKGQCTRSNGKHVILLDEGMDEVEHNLVAWHEAGHYLLGHLDLVSSRRTNRDDLELEADLVALCALIPQPLLTSLSMNQIVRKFDYEPCWVALRGQMYRYFNL